MAEPLDWITGIGGLATGIGSLISSAATGAENLALQKQTNQQNLMLQKEAWAREDTAVARRVKDLKNAGLNPVLAAGQAAQSGAPVKIASPQREKTDFSGLMASQDALAARILTMKQTQKLDSELELLRLEQEKKARDVTYQDIVNDREQWNLDYWKNRKLPTDPGTIPKAVAAGDTMVTEKAKKAKAWVKKHLPPVLVGPTSAVIDWFAPQEVLEK